MAPYIKGHMWQNMPLKTIGRVSMWCNHAPDTPVDVASIGTIWAYKRIFRIWDRDQPYVLRFKYKEPITWYSPWVISAGLGAYLGCGHPFLGIVVAGVGTFIADKTHVVSIRFSNEDDMDTYRKYILHKQSKLRQYTAENS